MNIKSSTTVAGLALLGLFGSGTIFAATKAEISRSADRALTQFYTLNPTNRALALRRFAFQRLIGPPSKVDHSAVAHTTWFSEGGFT
jgi:hypothetical protein